MSFRYIPGCSADNNKGLILFNPEQYAIIEIALEALDNYDYTLSNSTLWVNVQSESHFAAFIKLLQIKFHQIDELMKGK